KLLFLNLRKNKLYQLDGSSDIIQMAPVVKILNLSKNEVQSAWKLGKMKGMNLEELWLKGNSLFGTFPNQSTYVRSVVISDGQVLPTRTVICVEASEIIKPCKESYKGSETLKNLILQCLLHSDSASGPCVPPVNTDQLLETSTLPGPPPPFPLFFFFPRNSLEEYFKDSRNIKKVKDRGCLGAKGLTFPSLSCTNLQVQLLKHTKYDIFYSLNMLPKTQHDLNSYVANLSIQMVSMCFLP
ncbi:hypothetical protein PANDA_020495, partial [Ailuropoda melanoleuca]